ncbi:type II secretion system protein N [Alkalisalibacterium limincola]|uniref:Type II secretion system protein N n=1 Tax=Alkalisalibacterium limincola TaxID=2699169 RepID=A0A5C8KM52_9GAMM|nr:type II secretion system protein N [Alkalisalibacterium limincola]TXK60576.1 type II secretion system protein N [Alkalisalibacterium limincola]
MRWILGVLVLLLALAVAVVAFAPAGFALGYLRDNSNGSLDYTDARGTLWRGAASGVTLNGEALGEVAWTLSPMAALRSRIDAQVRVDGPQGSGTGRIRRHDDNLLINDVDADLPATLLSQLLAHEGLVPQGRLTLQLEELTLRGRLPQSASGQLRWVDARVSGTVHAELGELLAEFSSVSEGRLDGVLSDAGGPLGLEGLFHVSWLGYGVEMILTPRTPALADALARIGQPDGGGSRFYAVEGRWLAPAAAPPGG